MLGAAIGDIVGSRFELDNYRTTDFELFQEACNFTDDTVCTAAIADWLLHGGDLTVIMRDWCCRYPNLAYGARFRVWLNAKNPMPYNSWGNGSAMRVSAVGWKFDTLPETLDFAKQSAQITHNHAEGIKGAQSVASAIFWARMGKNKAFIRKILRNCLAILWNELAMKFVLHTSLTKVVKIRCLKLSRHF